MAPHQIELRFSARDLANKDFLSLSDPFLVCHAISNGKATERIGRTETVKDDLNPMWTTTISFEYTRATASSNLLIDIFDRDSTCDDKLTKHDFLGRAILQLDALLTAPSMTVTLPLSSAAQLPVAGGGTMLSVVSGFSNKVKSRHDLPSTFSTLSATTDDDDEYPMPKPVAPDLRRATSTSRANKNVRGTLTVYAEYLSPVRGVPIVIRVASALLRDQGGLHRRVTQFYELQRERRVGNETVWSCVYRSKDGVNVDRNNYVVFDEMSVTEQQLHNCNPSRRLRLAFYKRHHRHQHELISYVTTSVAEVLSARENERKATIPLEGVFGDEEGLGNVLVTHVQQLQGNDADDDESGEIHFHLRADHFLHKKFVSSLNDGPKHVRKLRQLPTFITMH